MLLVALDRLACADVNVSGSASIVAAALLRSVSLVIKPSTPPLPISCAKLDFGTLYFTSHTEHVDVVDLPATAVLFETVVEDRIALALGAHDDFAVGPRRASASTARSGRSRAPPSSAHDQDLELVLQALLLLGRRAAATAADGRGRHALELHVRHDLGVDQGDDLAHVAAGSPSSALTVSSMTSVEICSISASGAMRPPEPARTERQGHRQGRQYLA